MAETQTSIDFSYLDDLLNMTKGKPNFVRDCVQRFLNNADNEIKELKNFNETNDRALLKAQSHHLISTCSVVGAHRMIELSRSLSKQALNSDVEILKQGLLDLDNDFQIVKDLLNDYLAKLT